MPTRCLAELAWELDGHLYGDGSTPITGIAYDSQAVAPGYLFACLPGTRQDGHLFASQAVACGAAALLVERLLPLDVPQLVVPDARRALGLVAAAFWGGPLG